MDAQSSSPSGYEGGCESDNDRAEHKPITIIAPYTKLLSKVSTKW